jgi:hypothetical protein
MVWNGNDEAHLPLCQPQVLRSYFDAGVCFIATTQQRVPYSPDACPGIEGRHDRGAQDATIYPGDGKHSCGEALVKASSAREWGAWVPTNALIFPTPGPRTGLIALICAYLSVLNHLSL